MKAEQFVATIRSYMPEKKTLEAKGFDAESIEEFQSYFTTPTRTATVPAPAITGEIGRLLTGFDCSRLTIKVVEFAAELSEEDGWWQFARAEADPLAIAPDGQVIMLDHALTHAAACIRPTVCAASPEHFLDAIAVVSRQQKEQAQGQPASHSLAVDECVRAAGNLRARAFWGMLS